MTDHSRRHFLLSAGAAAAAAGASATLAGRAALKSAPPSPQAKRTGYRRTAHIGNYYRTAKF